MTEETPTSVPTPATPDSPSRLDSVQYVGFWRRVGAFALDVLVLGIVGQLLGLLFAHKFMSLAKRAGSLGSRSSQQSISFRPITCADGHLASSSCGSVCKRLMVAKCLYPPLRSVTLRYTFRGS
jgi:hypothetical protein